MIVTAIAESVAEWQKLKEEGKLGTEEEEEEDIYAKARMADVSQTHTHVNCIPCSSLFPTVALSLYTEVFTAINSHTVFSTHPPTK